MALATTDPLYQRLIRRPGRPPRQPWQAPTASGLASALQGSGSERPLTRLQYEIRSQTRDGAELAEWLLDIVRCTGEFRERPPLLDTRVRVAMWLVERGWGKAPFQITDNDGQVQQVVVIPLAPRQVPTQVIEGALSLARES